MAILAKTYGVTLVVNTGTIQYYGPDVNNYFCGSPGDRITMLKFDAPASLDAIEYIASAILRAQIKGDTTSGSGNVTIGLISGAWGGNNSGGYSTLYGYCNGPTVSKAISYTTTTSEKQLDVKSLLQTWAQNPSAYSGLYLRNSALPLARISGTGCDITTSVGQKTACGAPSSVLLSKTFADSGESVSLSWSGATPGAENPITGYDIYKNTNGGPYTLFRHIDSTATSGSTTITANSTQGAADGYKIVTKGTAAGPHSGYSAEVTITTMMYTACGAPETITLSKGNANPGETITLSWAYASAGIGNPITGYDIYKSTNGGPYSLFRHIDSTATSGSTTITANSTQGAADGYKIVTRGTQAGLDSGYSAPVILYTQVYTAPYAPTTLTLSAPMVNPGNNAVLSWSGQSPGTNNPIAGYEIHRATSLYGVYTKIADASSSPYTVTAPATGGSSYYFKVLAKGTVAGLNSGLSSIAAVLSANARPSAPSLNSPIESTTIYNSRPRILLTVGTDAEGHAQTISVPGYTPSSEGAQPAGKKLIFRKTSAASAGAQNIAATSTDSLGSSGPTISRGFNYSAPIWDDGTLVGGTSRIKAAHMIELRTAINAIRAYYGMDAYEWAEPIIAGFTSMAGWQGHVTEMRTAIEQVASLINTWDTTGTGHKVTLPAWITITGQQPMASVIEQLKAVIAIL